MFEENSCTKACSVFVIMLWIILQYPPYVIEPVFGIWNVEVPFKHNWHLTCSCTGWDPVHIHYYLYRGLDNKAASYKSRCRSTSLMSKHIWYWSSGQALIGTWNGHTWSSSRAECPLFACSTKGTADKVSGVFTRAQCSAASSPIPHASLTTPQPVWGQGLWGWWTWADTFLLTITSHGPTFRFPCPLLFPPIHFHKHPTNGFIKPTHSFPNTLTHICRVGMYTYM